MTPRLFLTGPIGCGKSTALRAALGEALPRCGGFLTRRYPQPHLHFTLERPDGALSETFLDFSSGKPRLELSVFSGLGVELLRPGTGAGGTDALVLDEIGGIELLNADFTAVLEEVLESGVPILGVLKGPGPAGALTDALGLTREYTRAAARLRARLLEDPGTLVYQCGQYDETARLLAEQWCEEYLHEQLL